MKKKVIFFTQKPPLDKKAIHIWLGKTTLSHEQHLCQILKQYLGSSSIDLSKSPKGKLYLPNSSLHFNLSDSEDFLAIALSWEAPVGIDIEKIRPVEDMEQMMEDYFSSKEQAYVRENDTLVRFWEIWNRKEACFKALGLGMQDEMTCWDCSGDGWVFVNKVWVRSLPVKHSLSAAVAVQL